MIRYNPNSPEILGKKQYNVLNGFAYFCFTIGVCISYFGLYFLFTKSLRHHIHDLKDFLWLSMDILCIYSGPYFILLGIFSRNRNPKAISCVLYGFFSIFLCFVCSFIVAAIIFDRFNINYGLTRFITEGFYVTLIFMSLAYYLCLISKTYKIKCMTSFFPFTKKTPYGLTDITTEPVITVFQENDPLNLYGRFWVVLSISYGIITSVAILSNLYRNQEGSLAVVTSIYLPMLSVFTATAFIGYGLLKYKEWARMLMLFVHCAALLLALYGAYSLISKRFYDWEQLSWSSLLIPIAHWCYFVIRTLSSPVVKYVCLRGGHDID